MKMHPMRAELFRADRRTDMTKLISLFANLLRRLKTIKWDTNLKFLPPCRRR